jgi:hypothetical protein
MIRAETDKRSPAIADGRSRDASLSVAAPGREPSRKDCPGVCVAQESDDVALDVSSLAVGAGLIANRKPEERHFANDFAHLLAD